MPLLPAASKPEAAPPPPEDAHRELLLLAARSLGIATARDLADGHLGDDGLATTFYAVFDADDLMRQFAS